MPTEEPPRTAPSSLQSRLRTTALYAALSLAPALGLAQGGVMNLLNSLGGGSSGGGLLGAVTGQSAQPQGEDLISLLSRSVENIDEAREIRRIATAQPGVHDVGQILFQASEFIDFIIQRLLFLQQLLSRFMIIPEIFPVAFFFHFF